MANVRISLCLATASWAIFAAPAASQSTPEKKSAGPPASDQPETVTRNSASDNNATIGDIVVTAQRREQTLSNIGLSITAIGSDALVTRNFNDVADLGKFVPGLSISDSGYSTPIYTLRGVGINEQSIGSSSSIAVYVDEVPLAYPVLTQGAALDLQRIEVLKGPQGTLYGQNSTGGAINYIPNKPTDELQVGLTSTIGRFGRGIYEGFISGPVAPALRARIAARASVGEGWQRSLTRNDSLGRIRNFTGRAIIDWDPSATLKVALTVNGWTDKSDTVVPQLIKVFPGNSFNVDRNIVVLDPTNPASCSVPVNRLPGCPLNADTRMRITAANQPVVTRPSLIPGLNARDTDWDVGQDFKRDDKFWQAALRLGWDLSDDVQLTSITSYAHFNRRLNAEDDGIAISENPRNVQIGSIRSFGQEIRLAADWLTAHWLVGANLSRDTTSDIGLNYLRNGSNVQNIFGFQSIGGGIRTHQDIRTQAVFGNVDLPLFEQLAFSGGLRFSKDDRRFEGCGFPLDASSTSAYNALYNSRRAAGGLPSGPPIGAGDCFAFYDATSPASVAAQARDTAGLPFFVTGLAHRRLEETNVPWYLNLNYKPSPSSLIYARVSRGFKAGNFSTLNSTDLVVYNPVVQEKLTAYELGAKASFGQLLHLEAAVFRYDYVNKQLRARIFVGPPFGNIGSQDTVPASVLKGVELSATVRPVRGLTISGSGTYIDSKITRYVGQTIDGVLQDQSGSPFNFTPKWSINGDINYVVPLTSNWNGFIGSNLAYRSKTSAVFVPPGARAESAAALAPFEIRSYTLVDGQLGIETGDGRWKAFIWGKNIFNKYYWNNVVRVSDVIIRFPGQPVTYGVTASMRF